MLRLRPYKSTDAGAVLSWCRDERAFYKWTAGVMGDYPITEKEFGFVENLMAFIAFDENGIQGFFTMRNPGELLDELRFGFIIVNSDVRGKGYGKAMLQLGLKYAFDVYCAKKVSLGVFENNLPAYHCYKAAGFEDVVLDTVETYSVLGEEWECRELMVEKR